MNLRKIDLNLLVFFDALMKARHVSQAARYLGVGQPAVSAALGRLRKLMDDPLLVRRGNEMEPTQRALELEVEVAEILRDVAKIFEPPGLFMPATSERTFRLRMSDLLTFLLLQDFVGSLEREAPGLRLIIDHLSPSGTCDALMAGDIDLAVSTGLDVPKSIRTETLCRDEVVCIARRDLDIRGTLANPGDFARAPQIRVSQSPIDFRFADETLKSMGLERNIQITVPHWLSVPDILSATSLIAAVPATFAERIAERHALAIYRLDFFETGFDWTLYWHDRFNGDTAHRWFREKLAESCRIQFDAANAPSGKRGSAPSRRPARCPSGNTGRSRSR